MKKRIKVNESPSIQQQPLSEDSKIKKEFHSIQPESFYELTTDERVNGSDKRLFYHAAQVREYKQDFSTKQMKFAISRFKVYQTRFSVIEENPVESKGNPGHLSVRVAWHDSGWNGRICSSPEDNIYCIGEHSLLSKRLREHRDTDIESGIAGQPMNSLPSYLPPCYWCINVFGNDQGEVEHKNPACDGLTPIKDELPPHSLFTWPFLLSFAHERDGDPKDWGKYPPEDILDLRLKTFLEPLQSNKSVAFLYCNFDNPLSADVGAYLLVGCGLLESCAFPKRFTPLELIKGRRARSPYQNFPDINWALPIRLNEDSCVRLPYQECLSWADRNHSDEILEASAVILDDPMIQHNFKYVAMGMDDDLCIYLLKRMASSIRRIAASKTLPDYDYQTDLDKIDDLLDICWTNRGTFPGMIPLISKLMMDNSFDAIEEFWSSLPEKDWNQFVELIKSGDGGSKKLTRQVRYLSAALDERGMSPIDVIRLAMLNLTAQQFGKLLKGNIKEIANNPYLLYENSADALRAEQKGIVQYHHISKEFIDGPIPLYKIDIALFPDPGYATRIADLHTMKSGDPRRLRALVLDELYRAKKFGHCYDSAEILQEIASENPILSGASYHLDEDVLTSPCSDLIEHFRQKITLEFDESAATYYYYIKEIRYAEISVKSTIDQLLTCSTEGNFKDYFLSPDFIEQDALALANANKDFDTAAFIKERNTLYTNIFGKKLFVLSGVPGSGKSHEITRIIKAFAENGESYCLLAPTGKAVMRLRREGLKAQTLHKFLQDFKKSQSPSHVDNIIFDEMSMVGLELFHAALQGFDLKNTEFKRLILVGDEKQLPPIECGKPFIDIVTHIRSKSDYSSNFIRLSTNCRHQTSGVLSDLISVFSEEHAYPEFVFDSLMRQKEASNLKLTLWENHVQLKELVTQSLQAHGDMERLFITHEEGCAPDFENHQFLSPYTGEHFGTEGLNRHIQSVLGREEPGIIHAKDKVIVTKNEYQGDVLILSNGTFGKSIDADGTYHFQDENEPICLDRDLEIDLAYAISVHKSQGSGFQHVHFILPAKQGLLFRELVYTALSRPKSSLHLYLQVTDKDEPLRVLVEALKRSYVSQRRTSIFGYYDGPAEKHGRFEPEPGKYVASKGEYIIYKALKEMESQLGFTFEYELPLPLKGFHKPIKPDFTIKLPGNMNIYWEHLGMLDNVKYINSWMRKKDLYSKNGIQTLVTTDDLAGISHERCCQIICDIIGERRQSMQTDFSDCHYSLGNQHKIS